MHEPPFPPAMPQPTPPELPELPERPAFVEFSPFEPFAAPVGSPAVAPRWEPITLSSVARDVVDVLRSPRMVLPRSSRPWAVWWRVVALYCMGMFVAGLVVALGIKASGAVNLISEMNSPKERLTLLLLAGVIAPLWEETAFRLPLAPFHAARVVPPLALIAILLGLQIPAHLKFFLLAPLLLGAILALPTIVMPAWRARVFAWWHDHFRWVLVLSILGFGFAHASNYRFPGHSAGAMLFIPMLVLPQLVGGALLAYVRLKLGFWFGVLLHAGVNTFLVGLTLLAPDTHAKPLPKPGLKPHSTHAAPRSSPRPRRRPTIPARTPASVADNASTSA